MSAHRKVEGYNDAAVAFESLVTQMSAAFVRVTADQIDDEIRKWLRRIVVVLGIDRCTVGQFDPIDGLLHIRHQWSREGIAPNPASLNVKEVLPWLAGKILAEELVVISNVNDETPPEAQKDREYAALNGAKSNVTIPLRVDKITNGAIAFDSVQQHYFW
jgi:formate hydrogenlyase transcriptional activator